MKITKIKTRMGEFGAPVSTELEAIVERMRSEETKDAAEKIGRVALLSRLAMKEGMPHYFLTDTDRLPYLLFSATFGKGGFDHPNTLPSCCCLTFPAKRASSTSRR